MDSLLGGLERLDLQDTKVVAFSDDERGAKFDPIPRYLFRVFDTTSPGESNEIWIKSKTAVRNQSDAGIDIFKRRDRLQAAHSLWGHLDWQGLQDDNLMSWTSSLLFAIQYIFYRHNKQRPRPSYTDIKICVLDTQRIAQGAFVRDTDLMEAFAPVHEGLRRFAKMRSGKHYFGEYLSQGALNIEGHNTMVSAQAMINNGLLLLRPEFSANLENSSCGWANDVVAMYAMLEQDLARPEPRQTLPLVGKALRVAQLFGQNYRLHVAVSLVAIVPGQIYAETIARAFRQASFSKTERLQTSQTCVYRGMSDLVRFREVQGMVHAECYQHDLQEALSSAQHCITQANDVAWTLKDECTSDHRQPAQLAVCEEKIQMMVHCLGNLKDLLLDARVSL